LAAAAEEVLELLVALGLRFGVEVVDRQHGVPRAPLLGAGALLVGEEEVVRRHVVLAGDGARPRPGGEEEATGHEAPGPEEEEEDGPQGAEPQAAAPDLAGLAESTPRPPFAGAQDRELGSVLGHTRS